MSLSPHPGPLHDHPHCAVKNYIPEDSDPRTMYRIKKAAAGISGWDRPLLTFIYPGFHCGSTGNNERIPNQNPPFSLAPTKEARKSLSQSSAQTPGLVLKQLRAAELQQRLADRWPTKRGFGARKRVYPMEFPWSQPSKRVPIKRHTPK